MQTKGNNSEAQACREYKQMPIEHLEGGVQLLASKAKNLAEQEPSRRLSNGQKKCRRRMEFVLKRKKSDKAFADLANERSKKKPSEGQNVRGETTESKYNEAYQEGKEHCIYSYNNPHERGTPEFFGYRDGFSLAPRNFSAAKIEIERKPISLASAIRPHPRQRGSMYPSAGSTSSPFAEADTHQAEPSLEQYRSAYLLGRSAFLARCAYHPTYTDPDLCYAYSNGYFDRHPKPQGVDPINTNKEHDAAWRLGNNDRKDPRQVYYSNPFPENSPRYSAYKDGYECLA